MEQGMKQGLKTVLMVGRTECGKTTLSDLLVHGKTTYHKTQAITRIGSIIDTPGEYIENPNYYRGIILNAYEADVVIFINAADDKPSIFPPNFAHSLNRDVIGVISKVDTGHETDTARFNLTQAGVSEIYEVSMYDPASIERLRKRISHSKS